ncbi:myosin ATPase [Trifolium repens]|nr:myosin ATPase [Trifolium repens]
MGGDSSSLNHSFPSLPLSPTFSSRLVEIIVMAASEQQVPTKTPAPDVGRAFADQYYQVLHEIPQDAHKFYQEVSKLGRPEPDGIMGITTTVTVE